LIKESQRDTIEEASEKNEKEEEIFVKAHLQNHTWKKKNQGRSRS
jgi:hypothetical protein